MKHNGKRILVLGSGLSFCLSGCTSPVHAGNASIYDLDNVEVLEQSPLEGKNIAYLGSSVTYGSASNGISFVEYISKRNKCTYIKEAVSGTTLVDESSSSYVSRLKTIDKNAHIDIFVVQLSTNDATQNKALGTPADSSPNTICGAINTIISYVKETYSCPVVFYTNAYYENDNYQKMVNVLKDFEGITIIDMYSDSFFNNISDEERELYMVDKIHPSKAGYLKWWTPYMEQILYKV